MCHSWSGAGMVGPVGIRLPPIGAERGSWDAHDRAVKAALAGVEKNAAETRMKDPVTGQMVRAGNQKIVATTFGHDTSRNLDPQLHTHAVVANMVRGEDGKWRSMANEGQFGIGAKYGSRPSGCVPSTAARDGDDEAGRHADYQTALGSGDIEIGAHLGGVVFRASPVKVPRRSSSRLPSPVYRPAEGRWHRRSPLSPLRAPRPPSMHRPGIPV